MLNTEWQKSARRYRTEKRDMERDGWEYVGENGGLLWELHRGYRQNKEIVGVKVAYGGKALWIKVE